MRVSSLLGDISGLSSYFNRLWLFKIVFDDKVLSFYPVSRKVYFFQIFYYCFCVGKLVFLLWDLINFCYIFQIINAFGSKIRLRKYPSPAPKNSRLRGNSTNTFTKSISKCKLRIFDVVGQTAGEKCRNLVPETTSGTTWDPTQITSRSRVRTRTVN